MGLSKSLKILSHGAWLSSSSASFRRFRSLSSSLYVCSATAATMAPRSWSPKAGRALCGGSIGGGGGGGRAACRRLIGGGVEGCFGSHVVTVRGRAGEHSRVWNPPERLHQLAIVSARAPSKILRAFCAFGPSPHPKCDGVFTEPIWDDPKIESHLASQGFCSHNISVKSRFLINKCF